MRGALLAVLLASAAVAQPRLDRIGPFSHLDRTDRLNSSDASLLRILPTSGGAPGGECSGTAITGTRGETVTFTRASAAYCTKSDGTMVSLTNNQPRVSLVGGAPMLLVEGASTNLALQSEATDNVAWTSVGILPTLNGSNVATITPWGTTTAEDWTFQATGVGQDSVRGSNPGAVCGQNLTCSYSYYVYGVGNSCTIDICRYGSVTGACKPSGCSVVDGAWNRCTYENVAVGATGDTFNNVTVGNSTKFNGGTARSSCRVLVVGMQTESGSLVTSYIATAGTTATRAAETDPFSAPAGWVDGTGCAAADIYAIGVTGTARVLGFGATNRLAVTSTVAGSIMDGTNTVSANALSTIVGRKVTLKGTWTGSTLAVSHDGQTASGTYDGAIVSATVHIGTDSAGASPFYGYIGNVRLGASTTACDR